MVDFNSTQFTQPAKKPSLWQRLKRFWWLLFILNVLLFIFLIFWIVTLPRCLNENVNNVNNENSNFNQNINATTLNLNKGYYNQNINTNFNRGQNLNQNFNFNLNLNQNLNQNFNTNQNLNVNHNPRSNTNISGAPINLISQNDLQRLWSEEFEEKQNVDITDLDDLDRARVYDLISLKYDLKKYYLVYREYPKSQGKEKIDGHNDSLSKAMEKFYGGYYPIKVDPEYPSYYYGYTSNGENFELTCYLVSTQRVYRLSSI